MEPRESSLRLLLAELPSVALSGLQEERIPSPPRRQPSPWECAPRVERLGDLPPPQECRDCSYFGEQRLVDATLVLVHSRSPGSRGPHAVQRSLLGVGHVSPDDGDGGPEWTALDAHVLAEVF